MRKYPRCLGGVWPGAGGERKAVEFSRDLIPLGRPPPLPSVGPVSAPAPGLCACPPR